MNEKEDTGKIHQARMGAKMMNFEFKKRGFLYSKRRIVYHKRGIFHSIETINFAVGVIIEELLAQIKAAHALGRQSKMHEFCAANQEICLKNEELSISNDEFCRAAEELTRTVSGVIPIHDFFLNF